jgi:hypothetical protein
MNQNQMKPPVRRAVTLPEMLVALTITTLIVGALGVFSRAVLDGVEQTTNTGNASQEVRVILARIDRKVAESRRIVIPTGPLRVLQDTNEMLVLWERDGQVGDPNPGLMNYNELLIYTTPSDSTSSGRLVGLVSTASSSSGSSPLLWEVRPAENQTAVVDVSDSTALAQNLQLFRSGQNIEPPTVLLSDLGGIQFDTVETTEPESMGGLCQQNTHVVMHISPANQTPTIFCASMFKRYVPSN